ncbi:MAG: spermidine synthase [Deltaproteobacteria bacterium]|nr:spermidine synthase [Deltaproteobacteria bacterium]
MTQPWQTIDRVDTADGVLELRRRGERDFLIIINGRVLMNSSANRSEIALGEAACRAVAARKKPRVLIGGLGMGLTLRAALDSLPPTAQVVVAELNPVVIQWCRGPLSELTGSAVDDGRVTVAIEDVSSSIAKAAQPGAERFDAIIIDLYEGPGTATDAKNDPFYGSRAVKVAASALSAGGVFAVWGENSDAAFEKRLTAAGFSVERQRPGRGGLRHVVYLAKYGR